MSFSQQVQSTFPTENELLAPQYLALNQQVQQRANALLPYQLQEAQQKVGDADMEVAARMAGTLMDPTLYPTTEARAAAYPGLLSQWQQRGFLKNAPTAYPGDAQAAALARMGTPSQTQAEWGANIRANQAYSTATGATPPAAPGGGGTATASLPIPGRGTGGPGASANMPPEYLPYVMEAAQKYGLPPDLIIAQMRQESGFDANAKGKAGEIGLMQIMPSTAQSPGVGMQGVDPATLTGPQNARNNILFGAAYLRAHMGNGDPNNPAVQAAALHGYNGGGDPNYVANVFRYRPSMSQTDPQRQTTTYQLPVSGPQVAGAPPPAAPGGGVAARVGGTDVAGPPGVVQPPAATPPAPAATPPAVPPTPQNGLTPGQPGAPPAVAPQQQAQAAPPPSTVAPPAPSQAPPGAPQPPQLEPLNARGVTARQQAQIDALASTGRLSLPDRIKMEQGLAQQNIAVQQKAFGDWIQLQQLQTSQGQLNVSQQNSALEYWKAAHPDAKVTLSGGEIITQDPRTGQEIAPRIPVTPDRPETAAMVTISRLAPRVASGQATPEEQAQYATAVDTWRQPELRKSDVTGDTIRVNKRELPAGFPEPPPLGGGPASAGAGGPQVVIKGLTPAQEAAEKKAGDDFVDKDSKAYTSANNSLYSLGQMNNAAEVMDRTPGSWTATGPGANIRLSLGQSVNQIAGLFGIDPPMDPAAVGSWEALNKNTKLMGFKMINAAFGASREAASVIQNATSAVPGAENSYLGFRLVSSGIEQELARERELYQYKAQLMQNGKPLAGAEAQFNVTHPVNVYTQRAIANAVPDDMATYLQAHPDTVKAFDGHFGPGVGEFILKGGRTGLGSEAARVQ